MNARRRMIVVGVLMLASKAIVLAGEVKVIANAAMNSASISDSELRSVFLLQRKTLNDGTAVEPVLQKRGPVHDAFCKHFLSRDGEEIGIYYDGIVFTGKGSMPKQLNSDADVLNYVARTPGAIGYVSSSASADGVKVLMIVSEKAKKQRSLLMRVEPEYPKELRQRGIEGTVRLVLTVSPKGSVEGVQVNGGNPILAEAAVKAVKRWVYSPSGMTSVIDVSIPFEARQ
jgi:TonB family protein